MTNTSFNPSSSEGGFALLDVLLASLVLSMTAVAVTLGSVTISRSAGIILRKTIAVQLASTKLEEISSINPSSLNDTYDSLELGLYVEGNEFSRTVNITVNADGSRTAEVSVSSQSGSIEPVTLDQTFTSWGSA